MPKIEYNCVKCNSKSHVNEDYKRFAYVREQCCSVSCYNKKNNITPENTQEGRFELTI